MAALVIAEAGQPLSCPLVAVIEVLDRSAKLGEGDTPDLPRRLDQAQRDRAGADELLRAFGQLQQA